MFLSQHRGAGAGGSSAPATPGVGDAFGALLGEELTAGHTTLIIERDDGFIFSWSAAHFFNGPEDWSDLDHRAVDRCRGRVLDIGAGAGRAALELQRRGHAVTALDISPGAVKVARKRGVTDAVCTTVDDHTGSYDTLLLLGNNLELCGDRQRAPRFFAALAALAAPGARLIAHGTDVVDWLDPEYQAYAARNIQRGELGGLMRVRVRYRAIATEWQGLLFHCSPAELAGLIAGTGWRIEEVDDADSPMYLAILSRT